MQTIWRAVALAVSLASCAGEQKATEFSVAYTLSNYETGVRVSLVDTYTDLNERLRLGGALVSQSTPYHGVTSAGLGTRDKLPKWLEIRWRERGPEWDISNAEYAALDKEAREARGRAFEALPIKSARIAVRDRIPADLIEDLKHSPLDPDRSNLPLKSLRLYFIWTKEGVKLRWRVYEKCCKVLNEGGDAIDYTGKLTLR